MKISTKERMKGLLVWSRSNILEVEVSTITMSLNLLLMAVSTSKFSSLLSLSSSSSCCWLCWSLEEAVAWVGFGRGESEKKLNFSEDETNLQTGKQKQLLLVLVFVLSGGNGSGWIMKLVKANEAMAPALHCISVPVSSYNSTQSPYPTKPFFFLFYFGQKVIRFLSMSNNTFTNNTVNFCSNMMSQKVIYIMTLWVAFKEQFNESD